MSQKQLSTVYVADLPVDKDSNGCPISLVDEDFLRNLFQDYGVVEDLDGVCVKVKIGRNGNPYAFAFIKFKTHEDAVNAISELNYTKLDNVPIRMILADEKTKTIAKSNQASLFIKNLDPDIEVTQFHDAFANFGEIISCKIPTDTQIITKPDGTNEKKYVSRGYGYVQFRNPEDSKQAMEYLKDASLNGRPIEIQPFYGHQSNNFVEFYEDLKNICEEFGDPTSCKIFTDENGKSEQFGFCVMESHESAVEAVTWLDGREIGNSVIMCYGAISKEERKIKLEKCIETNNEKIIYVKNFDENITEDELTMIFSQFGHIESAKIIRDDKGNSKKIGFICFQTQQQLNECIQQSPLIQIHGKQCYVTPVTKRRMNELSKSDYKESTISQQIEYQQLVHFDIKPILKNEIIQKYPNNSILLQSLSDMSIIQLNELAINQQLFNKWIEQNNNQFQSNILSEVICPVTDAKFTLVRNEIPQSITSLSQWAKDILSRSNDGKNINISVDCEGYFLGLSKNSLSTIQIGEIFDDSFDVRTNDKPPNVGQKPGFIILAPFSKKVVNILSSIFNNPNVMIYTFDFISDFATMIEIGIKINKNNVFDSQTANFNRSTNFFRTKTIKSLTWFVDQAKDMDPLGEKAYETKNKDKKNYFIVTSYLFKDKKHPEREIMNKNLFEMGSSDVYFTGLAALYCIKLNLHENVIQCTKTKIKQFYRIMNKMNSPLGPSITRQLFFFNSFYAKKYNKSIKTKNENESDLLDLLNVFKNTYTVISAYKLVSLDNTICEIDFDIAKIIYIETIKKLEEKKDLLNEMREKYA